jgi:iron complex outermembrane receptor protein
MGKGRHGWAWALILAGLPLMAAPASSEPGLDGPLDFALTEEDYFEQLPIALSGTRLRQGRADSPIAIAVIDREMIEASGAREIQELLRLAPGVVLSYMWAHHASVTMGFGVEPYSRRIEVLVDGRSVYTPTFGGVPWPMLPYSVSDIERIEVIRGPNMATYGTNAFLGTINIITRDPAEYQGGEIELLAGAHFVNRALVRYFGSRGRMDYRLTTGTFGDEGFRNAVDEWDGKQNHFASGHFRLQGEGHSTWHYRFGYAQGKHERGRRSPSFDPPRDQYHESGFLQANWESGTPEEGMFEFQIYHFSEDVRDHYDSRPQPALAYQTYFVDQGYESTRSDAEFQHTLPTFGGLRAVWGLGVRRDEINSPAYFAGMTAGNTLLRVFGQAEQRLGDTYAANIGMMVENDDITGTHVSPRIALNHEPAPGHALRVSWSRATRAPLLAEEMSDWAIDIRDDLRTQIFLASGGLDRERVDSTEFGYLFESSGGRVQFDTRLHYNHIQDIIHYRYVDYPDDPVDGRVLDFRNFDSARSWGLEAQVEYRPGAATRIVTNYAWTRLRSTDVDEQWSISAPRHNFSLLASHRFTDQLTGSTQYFRMSDFRVIDLTSHLPRSQRLDLRLAYRLHPGARAPQVAVIGQSVTGSYSDTRERNVFEPRVFGELRIPL